jgi:hypothetical protein
MSTEAKAGLGVARARVPLVDKETASPAQLAVWDRIAQSRGRAAGPLPRCCTAPSWHDASPRPATTCASKGR